MKVLNFFHDPNNGSAGPLPLILLGLILALATSPAHALHAVSGDRVVVDSPVMDDVLASGDKIDINAPVLGVILAGGELNINAPVKGDVIAAGGSINVNSDVGGKVVAFGGTIRIDGNVGTNLILAGGEVVITNASSIGRDALINAGRLVNEGEINGSLKVSGEDFRDNGSVGRIEIDRTQYSSIINGVLFVLDIVYNLGILLLGVIILLIFTHEFHLVEDEIRESPVRDIIVGFILFLLFPIIALVFFMTILGIPLALLVIGLYLLLIIISKLMVSFALGRKIILGLNLKSSDILDLVTGFIVINIISRLPYIGGLIDLLIIWLGFGGMFYVLRRRKQRGFYIREKTGENSGKSSDQAGEPGRSHPAALKAPEAKVSEEVESKTSEEHGAVHAAGAGQEETVGKNVNIAGALASEEAPEKKTGNKKSAGNAGKKGNTGKTKK